MKKPRVSVVIPTRNRPDMLIRAIRSVIAQTLDDIEVLVIIDGPDESTMYELRKINDNRIKTITLPMNVGASEARNVGVRHAVADWVAFLDDDDEWLPDKLSVQMAAAVSIENNKIPIILCKMMVSSEQSEYIWPPVDFPSRHVDITPFIFKTRRIGKPAGVFVTSMLFTRKTLLQSVCFQKMPRFQDVDWLLRAINSDEHIEFIGINRVMLHFDAHQNRQRISTQNDKKNVEFAIDWANTLYSSNYIDTNTYLHLVLGHISGMAKYVGGIDLLYMITLNGIKSNYMLPYLMSMHFLKWLSYGFVRFIKRRGQCER